jgi:predicted transcriptional regulator
MQTVRTTFTIRPSLLERLKIFTRETNRPMSTVVEEGISTVLKRYEEKRLTKMYQGLSELVGVSNVPITDASSNIDEILYGENGAWRGDHD